MTADVTESRRFRASNGSRAARIWLDGGVDISITDAAADLVKGKGGRVAVDYLQAVG